MKSDHTVCILDFDWAGKCGSAHYPYDLNMSSICGWHKEVTPGGLIEKEHDLYQLRCNKDIMAKVNGLPMKQHHN